MIAVQHLSMEELEGGLAGIRQAPADAGVLRMIVRRPRFDEREVLEEGVLDLAEGLVGDNWLARGSASTPDGSAHPGKQITVMSARVIALVAREQEHWPLAGDQLFIDLDLSMRNLPPGARLAIGSAVIEVSDLPHNGCKKFAARFGVDALAFISTPEGKQLRMRGLNAWVVQPGVVRVGDVARKL